MKKKLVVLWLVLMVLTAATAGAGELERIREKGVLTVSLNRDYPPFSMEKDGAVIGLDVDLAQLMAEVLGVEVKFIRPDAFDQQIPKLLAGEADIIMAAMTRTMERALMVNFSEPYFEVSQAALVRRSKAPRDARSYFDLLDIDGLRLGVKTGTTHEAFARKLFPTNVISGYPTAAAASEALVAGEVDAMVADSPFVQVWHSTHVQHYAQITALLEPVTREFYAFAIRKGDPDFLNWLNVFVAQIRTDGTMELLRYEYFEQMAWVAGEKSPPEKGNRPLFLKNRFMAEKKAMIEKRRRKALEKGASYD